jgi:hypothetical protein
VPCWRRSQASPAQGTISQVNISQASFYSSMLIISNIALEPVLLRRAIECLSFPSLISNSSTCINCNTNEAQEACYSSRGFNSHVPV